MTTLKLPLPPQVVARLALRRAQLRAEHLGRRDAAVGDPDPYLARACQPVPLDAREMVTDEMLRDWTRGWDGRDRGEIPADVQAELSMLLANAAAELLAYRLLSDAAARAGRGVR